VVDLYQELILDNAESDEGVILALRVFVQSGLELFHDLLCSPDAHLLYLDFALSVEIEVLVFSVYFDSVSEELLELGAVV